MNNPSDVKVRRVPIDDPDKIKEFLELERKFIGESPFYVSEIDSSIAWLLSGKSAFYEKMEHALFAASDNKEDRARCVAMINKNYQEAKDEEVGFIGYFAAAPNSENQVKAMFEKAETWLQEQKVSRVIAPFNDAAMLGFGLLTDTFDQDPIFPFQWHPPYYQQYLQNLGYQSTYPLWFYTIDFSTEVSGCCSASARKRPRKSSSS